MEEARLDVESGLDAWMTTLKDFFKSDILYTYSKGSALKKWDSHIDYVPIISDLDIHIMFKNHIPLFTYSSESFDESLVLSKNFEDNFNEIRPKHLHIPRSQILAINTLSEVVDYVPPRKNDIRLLYGTIPEFVYPSNDHIKQIDRNQLLDLEEFVLKIPYRLFDRTGIDLWSIIREMTFRVSPSPIRLLTQTSDNPLEIWSWNRTRIINELRDQKHDDIAKHYQDYYQHGWNLFLSGFKSSESFRGTITGGYYTLKKCIEEVKKMV